MSPVRTGLRDLHNGDHEGMTASGLRDDTTLVYRFDADTENSLWLARQLCEQWLRDRHVRGDTVCDMLLVLNELCTGATEGVVLRLGIVDGTVEIVVESAGGALVDGPAGDLRLAAAFCDEIVLRVRPERTTVRARAQGVVLPA